MKKIILSIAWAILFVFNITAQTSAPEITKAAVGEDGSVVLEWLGHVSEGDFSHAEVWYYNEFNSTPVLLTNVITPYESSYYIEHTNAQANSRRTYYYVINYNAAGTPFTSKTISPMYLTACISAEKVQLSWNALSDDMKDRAYYLYRKIGSQNWEFIDSMYTITYLDNPIPGFTNHSYWVYYGNKTDVNSSISNVTDPISYTKYKPIAPCITSLDVNQNNQVTLTWERSPSNNVVSYLIYLYKEATGGWDLIDQINSPDILTWTEINPVSNPCSQSKRYAVAPQDICKETGTGYPDSSKNNLLIDSLRFDVCNNLINLFWQPYPSMHVDTYEIYVAEGGGDFVKKAELPGNHFSTINYQYSELSTANTYSFKVRAVHKMSETRLQTVSSCASNIRITHPKYPEYSYFHHVSVNGNQIDICFEVDTTAKRPTYEIQRSLTGNADSYQTIAMLEPTGLSTICTIDSSLDLRTQSHSYFYLLNTVDSCGHRFPAETIANSILLKATEDEDHQALLEWTPYNSYHLGLYNYEIHRYIGNKLDPDFFVRVNTESYTDMSQIIKDQTQSLAYRVVAVENPSMTMESDSAYSNIAPLKRIKGDIWFPNAFTPGGTYNTVFRPIYSGFEVVEYAFTIFDRYGAVVFTTNDPKQGWNGKINGSMGTSGGYGYMLKMKTTNGDRYERRGTVVLVY